MKNKKSILRSTLLFIGLLLSAMCLAQQIVEVHVADNDEPLPGAFVFSSNSNKMLAQHVTDKNGELRYEWLTVSDTLIFRVEIIGYESKVITLERPRKDTVLNCLLKDYVYQLPNGEVVAKRLAPIFNNNDTSIVDITTFRDSSVYSIAALLARSPNIQLNPNGRLVYRGQEVSRVFIDGKDVFGESDYADPISRLSHNIVDRVDAIQNFHEDHVLARLEPSSETVLDITTTDAAKGTLNGAFDLGEGATTKGNWRYRHGANALLLGKQFTSYADAATTKLSSKAVLPGHSQLYAQQGRQEPIGRKYDDVPQASSLWTGSQAPAPIALTDDAEVQGGQVSLFHLGERYAKTRLTVNTHHSKDKLQLQSNTLARGNGLNYLLSTQRSDFVESSNYGFDVDHYNASSSGKTSWRLVGSGQWWQSNTGQLASISNSESESFQSNNIGQNQPILVGARVNQAVGNQTAIQFYVNIDQGDLSDLLILQLDSSLYQQLGFSDSVNVTEIVSQERKLPYLNINTGGKFFVRSRFGLTIAYMESNWRKIKTKQRVKLQNGNI